MEDLGDCAEWLYELLRGGGKKKTDVMTAGQKRGFSAWQIRRAREQLNIETPRAVFGGETVWNLPA
jgi:hypothetical protein